MGVVSSKSPLERRNTVLRRSQRKSIHGTKSKFDKITKEIKKFKGTEENSDYMELKAKIEAAEKELKSHSKNLQPQINHIFNETLKKSQQCRQLLEDKLKENQEKLKAQPIVENEDKDNNDVIVEEVNEEEYKIEETPNKRQTVELQVIQVEPIEASPQVNKRYSAIKIGVPVLPGSLMESFHRKNEEFNLQLVNKIANIKKEIEKLEIEISEFVGRRNGKYYNKIKKQLDEFSKDLSEISSNDDDVQEQLKLCKNYIGSCFSFLDEKAVDEDVDDDDDDDDDNVFMENYQEPQINETDSNLSPRSIRTTYI